MSSRKNDATGEIYEIFFRSNLSTELITDGDEVVQVGSGIILWQSCLNKHPDDRARLEMYIWRNGKPFSYSEILRGCRIACINTSDVRIYGEDSEKRAWYIQLGDSWSFTEGTVRESDLRVLPTREQITRLFEGVPFLIILSECQRKLHENKMAQMSKDVEFANKAKIALKEIYEVNKMGGQGSRKKVTAIIDKILQLY